MNYKTAALFALASTTVILSGVLFGECNALMTQLGDRDPKAVVSPATDNSDISSNSETKLSNESDVLPDVGPDVDSDLQSDSIDDNVPDGYFEECDDVSCYVVPSC